MKCKAVWLDAAEVFDAWRVTPRTILYGFAGLFGYVIVHTMHWYFNLPPVDRTGQVTAVIGIIIPACSGLAVWVYKIYAQGGRNWTGETKSDDGVRVNVSQGVSTS
jgi:hypothetical protein